MKNDLHMKSIVIARSDRGVFIGTEPAGTFCVFHVPDAAHGMEIGNVLEGVFDDSDGRRQRWVQNVTQGTRVHIEIEDWGCTRGIAANLLGVLRNPSKTWSL